ncbi:hypothetical protein WG922_09545 [Ramlibacter sp. AN1015]|uniref:hypothetical protein n=1 Tax=Ramlibacter sp. AN1015 TaxID=3133428 RepID=UPI0030BB9305
MLDRIALWLCLAGGAAAWAQGADAPATQGQQGAVEFSGSLRNMLTSSETSVGPVRDYTLDASRLRLEWRGQVNRALRVDFQYDNEVLAGDYLSTPQYRLEEALPRRTYWHLEDVYASGGNYVAQHRIRRANLTFSRGETDLRAGRQRIAWGNGRFWSPLDVLNPFSPVTLDPGEREGVDALLLEQKRSAVSRWSLAYAPTRTSSAHVLAQWHGNASGADYSLVGGRFDGGGLLGADISTEVRGAGVRAEWAMGRPQGSATHQRLMLGWDYAFANTLTLTAEFYYDGSGSRSAATYDVAGLAAGRRQTLATRYLGLYAGYELTPLWKSANWLVLNVDDSSIYLSPRLTYSLRENLDLAIGAQLHAGGARSEFGSRKHLWFAYAQWFF